MGLNQRYMEALERLPSFLKRRGNINSNKNWLFRSDVASGFYYLFKNSTADGFLDIEKHIKPIIGINADVDIMLAKQLSCALQRREVSLAVFNSQDFRSQRNISDDLLNGLNNCLMSFVMKEMEAGKVSFEEQDKIYQKALIRNQKRIENGKKPTEVDEPNIKFENNDFHDFYILFHMPHFQQNFLKELKERNLEETFLKSNADLYVTGGVNQMISGNMAQCLFVKNFLTSKLYAEEESFKSGDPYYKNISGIEFFKIQEKTDNFIQKIFALPVFGESVDKKLASWGSVAYRVNMEYFMTTNSKDNESKLGTSYYGTTSKKSFGEFLEEFTSVFLDVANKNKNFEDTELKGWFRPVPPSMWNKAIENFHNLGSDVLKRYKLNYMIEFLGINHFSDVRNPGKDLIKNLAIETATVERMFSTDIKNRVYSVRECASALKEVNSKVYYQGLSSLKKLCDDSAYDDDENAKYKKMIEIYKETNKNKLLVTQSAAITQHLIDNKVKKIIKNSDNEIISSDSFKL